MTELNELQATARAILDSNVYMVLGTADGSGKPWTSPVFYAAKDYRELYWISWPEATHSMNIATRPGVSIVIFNSRTPVGTAGTTALYLSATAEQLKDHEVEQALENYPGPPERGARPFTADELREPDPLRMYRAVVSKTWMLCPREPGVPCADHGRAFDHRTEVRL